jgi:hypothetical protein
MGKKDNTKAAADKKAAAPVKTTVKVNDKIAKAIEVIKEHQPHVKVAYFNQDGAYHFHKRPGFAAVPIVEDEEIDLEVENEEESDEEVDANPGGEKLEF